MQFSHGLPEFRLIALPRRQVAKVFEDSHGFIVSLGLLRGYKLIHLLPQVFFPSRQRIQIGRAPLRVFSFMLRLLVRPPVGLGAFASLADRFRSSPKLGDLSPGCAAGWLVEIIPHDTLFPLPDKAGIFGFHKPNEKLVLLLCRHFRELLGDLFA